MVMCPNTKKHQRKRLLTLTSVWMVYFYAWFLFSWFFTYHIFWNKSLFFRFIGGGRFSPMSTIIVIILYLHTYIFFWLHIKHWHQRATFLFGIYFDWYCANICFKLQPCTVPTYLFILTCKFNLFIKAYVIFSDRVYIFRLKSN